jgi:DNA-binding SARP family transcriptional activator
MENVTDFEAKALRQETESVAAGSGLRQALLGRLLQMAQRYRKEGNYRQATEMFWTLVHDHAETPEAAVAQAELLALAEGYERAGNQHMARSMYEKLMDLED